MTNNGDMPDISVDTLAETENYVVWSSVEPDGETTYHLDLGPVTVHLFTEEWEEFIEMIRAAAAEEENTEEDASIELDWGVLFFDRDEWKEFMHLIEQV